MKPDDKMRLTHMLESGREAITFLGDMSPGDLANNRMALNAIVRAVEVVGEAAAQTTPEFRARHPQIPWPQVIGMRNRLVHAYFDVDHEVVYSTVRRDIPVLNEQILQLLAE